MGIALITGVSSGIGRATALELAERGYTVFGTTRKLDRAQGLIGERPDIEVLELDVRDAAGVERVVRAVLDRAGRIDLLVNNAGVGVHGAVEELEDDEILAAFETNVFGPLRVIRAVTPHMREQGAGTIVNVSSLAGRVAAPMGGVYAATKHAIEALSDSLHFELLRFGVRVIVVEPGAFESRFHDNRIVARRSEDEESPYAELSRRFAEAFAQRQGGGQSGDPRDVARVIADAAASEQPKRRYIVGNDAETIIGLHKRSTDEEFETAMRAVLGVPDSAPGAPSP